MFNDEFGPGFARRFGMFLQELARVVGLPRVDVTRCEVGLARPVERLCLREVLDASGTDMVIVQGEDEDLLTCSLGQGVSEVLGVVVGL